MDDWKALLRNVAPLLCFLSYNTLVVATASVIDGKVLFQKKEGSGFA